ncbi:hypothetical protein ACFYYR_30855 [Streptomyces sp. NPDC001922]|uniref:hypothetical protein n=1 Tax=Streptomyces sp. NPDC001922 TaxID=3364624 RepID=UPI0036D10A7A
MPRPTLAQLAYGSATVVFATLAMLLLFRTGSGLGVTLVAVAGLALGLLVATTVAAPRRSARPAAQPPADRAMGSAVPAVTHRARVPRPRHHPKAGSRLEGHSVRR